MSPIIPKIAIWLWYQLHVFEDKKSRLSLNRECQKIHHIINFGPNVPKDNLKSELNTSFSLFVHSYNFVVLTDSSINHHHLKRRLWKYTFVCLLCFLCPKQQKTSPIVKYELNHAFQSNNATNENQRHPHRVSFPSLKCFSKQSFTYFKKWSIWGFG